MFQNQGAYPPQGGYPQGGYPQGGHPQGGFPQGGYPQGASPQGGYPQDGYPQGGYPQGDYPQGGYPQGGYPQGGYPQGGYPQGGYPQGDNPKSEYPQGGSPQGDYPLDGNPPPPQHVFQTVRGGDGNGETTGSAPFGLPDDLGEDGDIKEFNFSDLSIRRAFIRKVYAILMCQLLVTVGFIALFLFNEPIRTWSADNLWMIIVALAVVCILVISMACNPNLGRTAPTNFIFLGILTVAWSLLLGIISSAYQVDEVMMAVGITAALCLALTLFAFQTKWDFTVMGGALLCGLMVLSLFGLFCIFIQPYKIVTLVYASIGAFLFSIYLIYDTQLIMGGKHKYTISPEEYIFAALTLYLDITRLFIYILRIVGSSRR